MADISSTTFQSGESQRRAAIMVKPAGRALLVLAWPAAVGLAALTPGEAAPHEPALARMLAFMALIKAAFALAVLGASFWRLRWPVSTPLATGYASGACALAAASVLIWRQIHVPYAAVLFYGGLLGWLLTLWRDDGRITLRVGRSG